MKFQFLEKNSLEISFEFENGLNDNLMFEGKKGEILPLICQNKILVGLGKKENLNYINLRFAAFKLGKFLSDKEIKEIKLNIKEQNLIDSEEYVLAIVEGLYLSSYNFDYYKSEKAKFNLENIYITSSVNNLEQVNELIGVLDSQTFTRNLVNMRSNDVYPESLASFAKEELTKYGVKVTIYDEKQIQEMGLKAFYEVGKGSDKPPKFIVMEYFNGENKKPLVYVGKGLTYDAGGYSLKPSDGMKTMNSDMGGSATVIGAMSAIAKNNLKVNVVAIVAACENLVSGHAYKPGDVISSLAGKSIEVDNTDAEGRLTLADAVCYGSTNYEPEILIDLATLTGACLVALGERYSGVITNNKEALSKLQKAADQSFEKFWELPNDEVFKEQFKSNVADLKNTGGRYGGTITAGQFVGEFVKEGTNWIHMDIAGSAYFDNEFDCFAKGATGVHVKTLYNLAKNYSNEK